MKNSGTPQQDRYSRSSIAKQFNVNGGTVTAWVKAGCPQNPDGTFKLAEVERWLRERQEGKEARATLKDQKIQAEIERIQRDIRQRDHDYQVARGEVHSKSECAASLAAIRAAESRQLQTLGSRIAQQFPENGASLRSAIDAETKAMLERLHGGEAYK